MKKIKYLLFGLGIGVIILFIVIAFYPFSEKVKVTVEKKAYSYVSDYRGDETINILFYVNTDNTFITEKDNIVNSYLEANDTLDILSLTISSIELLEETEIIKEEEYYRYVFRFIPNLKVESPYFYESAETNLVLEYKQNDNVKVEIGSVSYYKVPTFNSSDISISRLRGIVNQVNGKKALVGIELGLRNLTKQNIVITKVTPLDINVISSLVDVKEIDKNEYRSSEDISNILGYSYNPLALNEENYMDITINEESNNLYLFPLKISGQYSTSKLGLSIEYKINGETKVFYFDDFVFFSESYNSNLVNADIYIYENS